MCMLFLGRCTLSCLQLLLPAIFVYMRGAECPLKLKRQRELHVTDDPTQHTRRCSFAPVSSHHPSKGCAGTCIGER